MSEFRIDSHVKPPKKRKAAPVPDSVLNAIDAYEGAYKRVHGVKPQAIAYHSETKMIRVGSEPSVSLMRLKELTRMLRARVD